ncbi:Rieske (2Fe-2S) protein [Saccharopolyspora sp. K220]|uniref:Rieske (2Fe-2S) protein n=1 Tax=Saccharopolyspora soli TaxID=2926618 RepID=UPI001F5A5B2D|nr:Rieske (2Fe-2S) protein [Saccharopolyspora soli]MCI2419470.1 Rieske (2Fe-2S) protein [Saccharopolyspora soli]
MRTLEPDSAGRVVVCRSDELRDGDRLLFRVGRRKIGLFRSGGRFFALHGTCPHAGGALCEGPLTGTALPTDSYRYEYGKDGQVLRCAWHGWEFDITTGRSLVDPKMRARTYPVHVDDGDVVVELRRRQ